MTGGGQFIEGFRSFLVAQMAVTDAQLDTGEITIAVRRDKAAPAIIPGAGQSQSVPVGSLLVPLLPEEAVSDLTADLCPGSVVGEAAK